MRSTTWVFIYYWKIVVEGGWWRIYPLVLLLFFFFNFKMLVALSAHPTFAPVGSRIYNLLLEKAIWSVLEYISLGLTRTCNISLQVPAQPAAEGQQCRRRRSASRRKASYRRNPPRITETGKQPSYASFRFHLLFSPFFGPVCELSPQPPGHK